MAQPTVAELLEQSRAAHQDYRSSLPRMAGGGGKVVAVDGDVVKAAAALNLAATLRKQAYDLDPDLTEDAWIVDAAATGGPNVLMTWYAEHLARTDDPVAIAVQRIVDGVDSPAAKERKRKAGGAGAGGSKGVGDGA